MTKDIHAIHTKLLIHIPPAVFAVQIAKQGYNFPCWSRGVSYGAPILPMILPGRAGLVSPIIEYPYAGRNSGLSPCLIMELSSPFPSLTFKLCIESQLSLFLRKLKHNLLRNMTNRMICLDKKEVASC